MIAGRPENWYWGFLIAPFIGLGALGYFYGRVNLIRHPNPRAWHGPQPTPAGHGIQWAGGKF